MADTAIPALFIDTSSLIRGGPRNVFLRQLFERCRAGTLRILISHIAWEEYRTFLREQVREKVIQLRQDFNGLSSQLETNFLLEGLPIPQLSTWSLDDIDAATKATMGRHARENRLEIIPIALDHAERTWSRYFGVHVTLPFDPEVKERIERRKDLPDAWIYEAAMELMSNGLKLTVLCHDGNLRKALQAEGAQAFRLPEEVIEALDKAAQPESEPAVGGTGAVVALPSTAAGIDTVTPASPVSEALAKAREQHQELDQKVLGYIASLGDASKARLFEVLEQTGIRRDIAENVATWLAMNGLVRDTGNHYLVIDPTVAYSAAEAVQPDVIKLLLGGDSSGT